MEEAGTEPPAQVTSLLWVMGSSLAVWEQDIWLSKPIGSALPSLHSQGIGKVTPEQL